nr:DUF433 domain-containing protein [candidate division KSB1 bacterium]
MNKLVTINPKVCNGKPVIRNTRIPVTVIIDQLADVGTIQGVLHKYHELSFEQVTAALHYC